MRGIHRPRGGDYVSIALLIALFFWAYMMIIPATPASRSSVTIGGTTIVVEVARTSEEQHKGLSGRETLPDETGMLFIFDHPDRFAFWMPDMHFAIDIVWIGTDRHIVDISPGVPPESYPATLKPDIPAQYVLEVPAGFAERYGWKVDDEVEFGH